MVVAPADDFFGGPDSKPFRSRLVNSPTWEQLFRIFRRQIIATGDIHHIYLEGVQDKGPKVTPDGRIYHELELITGS